MQFHLPQGDLKASGRKLSLFVYQMAYCIVIMVANSVLVKDFLSHIFQPMTDHIYEKISNSINSEGHG